MIDQPERVTREIAVGLANSLRFASRNDALENLPLLRDLLIESAQALDTLLAVCDAAEARVGAAERDAERYRWLRKYTESASGLYFDWYVAGDDCDWGDNAASFDTAIDTAINASRMP